MEKNVEENSGGEYQRCVPERRRFREGKGLRGEENPDWAGQ